LLHLRHVGDHRRQAAGQIELQAHRFGNRGLGSG
jgi:hypothetical protein